MEARWSGSTSSSRTLNAFTHVAHESALAAAAEIAPGDPRPFAGVPIAIKDNRPVAGMPLTMCSELFGISSPATTRSACGACARRVS